MYHSSQTGRMLTVARPGLERERLDSKIRRLLCLKRRVKPWHLARNPRAPTRYSCNG
jgi:hypothetical protein